jgi:predicted Zn-dependent protease
MTRVGLLCSWLALTSASVSALVIISVPQEITIGRQLQADTAARLPHVRDAVIQQYLSGIGRALVRVAPGPRYPYSFHVADRNEINAFALPGGPIWIYRGAICAAQTESQLAGVLAHEVAHIAARHAAAQVSQQIVSSLGVSLLSALLGNTGGAVSTASAAEWMAGAAALKFSRDDEREADRIGARLVRRAGWDARGLLDFMRVLRAQAQRDPSSVDVFFSTHPSTAQRIGWLSALVAGAPAGRRDSAEFQRVRRLLSARPARRR